MKIVILSRYEFKLKDTLTVSEYTLSQNSEYSGKSEFILHRKPKAEQDDFIILRSEKGVEYQGIISEIESEKGINSCTVTTVEMHNLFNQKVILKNETLLKTGVEDFISDQIKINFITSEDEIINIPYLNIVTRTHTPIAAAVQTDNGIYNLCTYMGNVMVNYGVFVDFEFTPEKLNIIIAKKLQPDFKLDTGISDITDLSENIEVKAMTKLTVLWEVKDSDGFIEKSETRHFFLRTDRTITEDKNDPNRAKGSSDIIRSSAETEEKMIQEAQDKFTANSYNHKITFGLQPSSKLVPIDKVIVGKKLTVKTESGIRDSIITAIERSNESRKVNVTLGQMKVTLIEKLKGVEVK